MVGANMLISKVIEMGQQQKSKPIIMVYVQ